MMEDNNLLVMARPLDAAYLFVSQWSCVEKWRVAICDIESHLTDPIFPVYGRVYSAVHRHQITGSEHQVAQASVQGIRTLWPGVVLDHTILHVKNESAILIISIHVAHDQRPIVYACDDSAVGSD